MTGVNNLLSSEWRARWYYIMRNKTTDKHYFGQTLRKDISKYLGSGIYWRAHCNKNDGYNKINIECVHKWWIDDRELAELLIEEFESKNPNYWFKTDKKWANLIQENTEDSPNFTNLSAESKKKAVKHRLTTLSKLNINGVTGFEKIALKISESKHKVQGNGLTVGQNGAIKAAKTKAMTINEAGLNIHQQIGKQSKETKNTIGIDGLNTHQRVGRELAKQKYHQIDEFGLNAHQRIGKAIINTKNSEKWKSTKGVKAKENLRSSLSRVEDNGKTVAQNRAIISGKTQTSEHWKKENYLVCDHCEILCSPGNYYRWHGVKCRFIKYKNDGK